MASWQGKGRAPVKAEPNYVKMGVLGVLALFFIIAFFSLFYQVASGQEGVLLTFSKADMVAKGPGLHLKIPFVQRVVKFDVQTQKYGVSAVGDEANPTLETAASSDLQVVRIQLAVNYHLSSGMTPVIFTNIGAGYEDKVISPSVHEATKACTAQFTATDLINEREKVRICIEDLLKQKLTPYNVNVEQVSITSLDFSKSFNDAIEAKVTAEQNKLQAQQVLERVQIEAKQKVVQAEADRDAAIATATGTSEAVKLNAAAEAEKVRLIQAQLSTSPNYIELQKVQRWNGNVPTIQMTSGGSSAVTPFFDMSSVLASAK